MKRLVGERKALAAAVLAFWSFLYTLLALAGPPPGLMPMIASLAGVYGLAFFGLVAGYFWARWFAVGLALFGVIEGVLGLWQIGAEPFVMFILITHGIVATFLYGETMAEVFDGQKAWRERMSMDDNAVARLGNAVTRLGVSLPMVLIWALMPKAGGLAFAAAGLALVATAGLLRLRTWGVLAMVGSAGLLIGASATAPTFALGVAPHTLTPIGAPLAILAAGLLLAGALPFFAPIRRFITRSP
jgi:hypothetical protein